MFNRINRKTFLILLFCIIGFTAVYLYYVKKQRQQNIAQYLPDPQAGDVYKIEQAGIVFYLQVKEVTGDGVYFYRSSMGGAYAADDIILNHFDSSEAIRYSKADLAAIKNGLWDDEAHQHSSLIEISRK